MSDFNPVPKPSHNRRVQKRGNKTKITNKARQEVYERSGKCCERCGVSSAYAFEVAHLSQASSLGSGGDPSNLALLCGPSVNTGTCHHDVDSTAVGRQWAEGYASGLKHYYRLKDELEGL